ncbi:small GTP-binding protein [Histomonas meleagridis]|uniref:small GTP-binding protein n=1 Tax=Histomonas meleagridis TaxID=135588 RepID=UPI0035599BD4|nr:small GTP-binding protein [Histomonas meleagridis]KAH0804486.1 small GTP-binding protein [Histomonas meleagridis]
MSLSEEKCKIVFLGETTTGKTSIICRYVNGRFNDNTSSTIGASFLNYRIDNAYNGQPIDLAIWDTAGQEAYRGLAPMYYRNTAVAVIVFDITQRDTFDQIHDWINEVRATDPKMLIVLVGNKIDLEENRKVKTEEGEQTAQSIGASYCETSAKSGAGLNMLFDTILRLLVTNRQELLEKIVNGKPVNLRETNNTKEECKC